MTGDIVALTMVSAAPGFDRILVPVDFIDVGDEPQPGEAHVVMVDDHRIVFTHPTLRAVELAASLGKAYGGTVRLLHATPPLQTSGVYSGPVSLPKNLIEEIHQRAGSTSTSALQQLGASLGSELSLEYVVRLGSPMKVILEEAARFDPSVVVMATSGRSRVARFFVGSTADRLIREAPCPVLVVPAGSDAPA